MKNSSKFDETIARNFMRSRRGFDRSSASSSILALNSSHDELAIEIAVGAHPRFPFVQNYACLMPRDQPEDGLEPENVLEHIALLGERQSLEREIRRARGAYHEGGLATLEDGVAQPAGRGLYPGRRRRG